MGQVPVFGVDRFVQSFVRLGEFLDGWLLFLEALT